MKASNTFTPEFVEYIPDSLQEGVLYVSMKYGTAAHRCACGCGHEVTTPLTPTDWQLHFDGVGVSLEPSIGNWSLPCRSHYWIWKNQVRWSGDMTERQIEAGRRKSACTKQQYYAERHSGEPDSTADSVLDADGHGRGLWGRLLKRPKR